jgi:hypothetical protein
MHARQLVIGFGRLDSGMEGRFTAQSGRGDPKGCSPLLSCMPADSATAHVQNGIAPEADVRNGEPKAAGVLTAGSSCGSGGLGSAGGSGGRLWRNR